MKDQPIGERIRVLRKEKNLTLEALSKRTGVTPQTISQLERGLHSSVKSEQLWLYAKALGVSMEFLLHGKDSDDRIPFLSISDLCVVAETQALPDQPGLGFVRADAVRGDLVFAFSIDTDAMLPLIPQNALLYCYVENHPDTGDVVLACQSGRVLLREARVEGGDVFLKSPSYPMVKVDESIKIAAVVVSATIDLAH